MAKDYDVPADKLIAKLADQLRKDKKIDPPTWSQFVKTGSHVQRIPQNKDWWYVRCASLLRKIYLHGPLGGRGINKDNSGMKKMDRLATEIHKELVKTVPQLQRYA